MLLDDQTASVRQHHPISRISQQLSSATPAIQEANGRLPKSQLPSGFEVSEYYIIILYIYIHCITLVYNSIHYIICYIHIAYMYVYVHVYTSTCISVHVHYIYIYAYVYVYVNICVYTRVCVLISIFRFMYNI